MFDRCVVINLDRRPERLAAFRRRIPADWPFASVERVPALDGWAAEIPVWYGGDGSWKARLRGAWGCFHSHLSIWRQALADGLDSVLVLEDDAVFCRDFSAKASAFIAAVPPNWDQIYLGGEHLYPARVPPLRVNDLVCRGRNVNRTHAYAIRRPMLDAVVDRLGGEWHTKDFRLWHVDYQLGAMHHDGRWNIYCPAPAWLVGQDAGQSDVMPERRNYSPVWRNEFGIVDPKPVPEAQPC